MYALQMGLPFWIVPEGVNPVLGFWLPIAAFLFAIVTQIRVKSTFNRYAKVPTRSGMSGAELAELLLKSRGADDVRIEPARGMLTDHYDPRTKTLRLSESVFASRSIAALGVAAHETGHALQHADAYAWLGFRNKLAPAVSVMTHLGGWFLSIGMLIVIFTRGGAGLTFLYVAAAGLAAMVVFTLVTLPVEIDASRRAMRLLGSAGILTEDELPGARKVLKAAAWTYVASAAAAIIELLRVLAIISSMRDRRSA